jgi:hypothetical protein
MKPLKQENLKELTEKVYDLLNETKISIGQNSCNLPSGKIRYAKGQSAVLSRAY